MSHEGTKITRLFGHEGTKSTKVVNAELGTSFVFFVSSWLNDIVSSWPDTLRVIVATRRS